LKPLSGKHLELIASLPDEKQPELVNAIIEGKLSTRQAEKAKEVIEKGLPVDKAVEAAKAPEPPKTEIEIAEITCPECGANIKVVHVDGKHKVKGG
jgi:uncharacterized protein (UPF0212 family)